MANPINLIKALAIQKGLDPAAVLAVARQEGLSGGIGDAGTSFGPWQLHRGGALPQNIPLSNAQSWAWSPAGLNYALSQMQRVAGGLHGRAAVENIVRRFERPADPNSEVVGALRSYEGGVGQGIAPSAVAYGLAGPADESKPSNNPLLRAVLNGGDLLGVIRKEYSGSAGSALRAGGHLSPSNAFSPLSQPRVSRGTVGGFKPAELLMEGTGGPTHSTGPHIHVAYTSPQAMLSAIALAESLGLNVRENPYTDVVDPVHAKHSYHYRTFPGKFNGRKLGEAIDVSGPRAKTLKFYAALKG